MTILLGDTGKIAYGSLKTFGINIATPQETLLTGGGVLTLPTTEPGTPQISYTIQASDLPTFSGGSPVSLMYVPILYVGGKIGVASTNLNYRILVNGVSQIQSSNNALSATLYWTYDMTRYYPVNVGDTVSVSIWSSQTDTLLDYYALSVQPTRMQLSKSGVIMKDMTYGTGSTYPVLSLGNPSVQGNGNFVVIPASNGAAINTSNPSSCTFPSFTQDAVYQTGRITYGDSFNSTSIQTHASFRPYYLRNYIPQTISFREVLR